MAGKCTVDGKDNKEGKTREEADMTLSPVFPKSSKVVQKGGRSASLADSNKLTTFGETLTTAWSQLGFLVYVALNSRVCFASGPIMHQHQPSSLALARYFPSKVYH